MADTPYRSATGEIDFATDRTLRPVNSAPQVADRPWGYAVDSALGNAGAMLANIPAAFGSQAAFDYKLEQEREAQAAAQLAARQGIPQAFSDVGGPVDFLKYAGNLGVQIAPMMGSIIGAGLLHPAAGAAAAYGWATGDVLGNQYEQAKTYDLGEAAAAAVPYAAVDYFTGLEGRLLRGFPESTAATWYGRAATHGATTMLTEGGGETFQEFMNSAGRAGVDPNFNFFGPEALDRYKESFIGGAVLGGFGGAMAGPLRENRAPNPINPNAPTDLLNPQPSMQAMAPLVGQGELNYGALDYGQGVNPYDIGGHVTALQQGNAFAVDSPQGEMFGAAQVEPPVVEQPAAPPPPAYVPPVAQPTQQTELPLPEQMGSNPYDAAGAVTALQQGQPVTVDSAQGDLFGTNQLPPQPGEVEIAPEDPVVTLRTNLATSLKEAFKETAGKEPSQARLKQLLQKHIGDIATPEEARAALAEAPAKYKGQSQQGTAQVVEKWKEAFDRLMPAAQEAAVSQEVPIGEPQSTLALTSEPQQAQPAAPVQTPEVAKPQAPKVDEPQSANMREMKLNKLFREAFGERNAGIARDVLEGTLTKEQIGKKHGITGQRVSQIGSQRALAEAVQAAARRMQMSDAELYELLSGENTQEAEQTAEEVVDELELGETEGYGTTASVGGSQSNWKEINSIGKLADEWATAKSAGDDVTAKAIEEKIKSIQQQAKSVDKQQSARDMWESMATEDAPAYDELSSYLQEEWADNVENGHDTLADMNNIVEKHQAETAMRDGPYEDISRFDSSRPVLDDTAVPDTQIEQDVEDDTGRKAKVKMSTREALADIKDRLRKAQELLACLKS